MAEADDRAVKLAVARKRLKAFQDKSNKGVSGGKGIKNNSNDLERESSPVISSTPAKLTRKESPSKDVVDSNTNEPVAVDSSQDSTHFTSSTESLRQISMQLNGLVTETQDFVAADDHDVNCSSIMQLEKRNQELALQLQTQTHAKQKFQCEVTDLKVHRDDMATKYQNEKAELIERHFRELGSLREQLQVHIQTIGILVAEKTELQSSLNQSQQTAKQKAGEVEEFHGRLKASRQRVTELEREVNSLTISHQQQEKSSKDNMKEVDRLKLDNYKITKTNEELQQQNSELTEKLNERVTHDVASGNMLEELRKSLAMAELKIKQLTNGDTDESTTNQLEELQIKNVALEKKIGNLNDLLTRLTEEREQANDTYQKYSRQLKQQMESLSDQVSKLTAENDELVSVNSTLKENVVTLRSQIDNFSPDSKNCDSELLESFQEKNHVLEKQLNELNVQYKLLVADNSQFMNLNEEKEHQIEQLEIALKEAQTSQMDKGRLLETIESDKVAASRAMAQNKELKKQLEELEDGFVKMSNDKLVLTEKLLGEQHITKELGERLSEQEEELKELREQLRDKERRLSLVQKSSTELTKQMYQQHQIADRMRHFEAQGHLTEMLQQELNQAQERINALTDQNNELRTTLANQTEKLLNPVVDESDENLNYDKEMARKDNIVVSLSTSIRQLEMERNQLLKQLEEQQHQRDVMKAQLKEMNRLGDSDSVPVQNGVPKDDALSTVVSVDEYRNLKQTFSKLEERFIRTMKEISDLSDQKQQLEHLVVQLQGETETISDYISLYHMQRSVMKQQVAKKDEYIASVCRDREQLKDKLAKLQELVYRLLYERQEKLKSGKGSTKIPGEAKLITVNGSKDEMLIIDSFSSLSGAMNNSSKSPPTKAIEGKELLSQSEQTSAVMNDSESKSAPIEPVTNPAKTAQRIINLIDEIGASNLLEKPVPDNFHPCPVCSGRLLTV